MVYDSLAVNTAVAGMVAIAAVPVAGMVAIAAVPVAGMAVIAAVPVAGMAVIAAVPVEVFVVESFVHHMYYKISVHLPLMNHILDKS